MQVCTMHFVMKRIEVFKVFSMTILTLLPTLSFCRISSLAVLSGAQHVETSCPMLLTVLLPDPGLQADVSH